MPHHAGSSRRHPRPSIVNIPGHRSLNPCPLQCRWALEGQWLGAASLPRRQPGSGEMGFIDVGSVEGAVCGEGVAVGCRWGGGRL